jgi:SAM-dependent methyltransferase
MNWLSRVRGFWTMTRKRARSEQDYLEFQAFQARWLIDYLEEHGVALKGKRLLDLGSGVGGYSLEFARVAETVISVDLMQPRRPESTGLPLRQVNGNALHVPLRSESMEVVFCASLIEHVREPEALLWEIKRILRPGCMAYVSFPPYYSPPGGHEFTPYHYLGERLALRLVPRKRAVAGWVRTMYTANDEATSFNDLYAGWGLYRMTIGKMRRLIAQTGFTCLDMSTRYLPVSAIRWPVLNELLTWHAQFLLQKPTTP